MLGKSHKRDVVTNGCPNSWRVQEVVRAGLVVAAVSAAASAPETALPTSPMPAPYSHEQLEGPQSDCVGQRLRLALKGFLNVWRSRFLDDPAVAVRVTEVGEGDSAHVLDVAYFRSPLE